MNNVISKKNIIFDFDGVIIDSMHIRSFGFNEIFKEYDQSSVKSLLKYHNDNGGLSRFVKIKYFFNTLLNQEISEQEISIYADKYSKIMRKSLISKDIIIDETLNFIKSNDSTYNMHIASGSEDKELNYLNQTLSLDSYFLSINGSPTPKKVIVKSILKENFYKKNETILIGDSINDYDAAKANDIAFIGYNNQNLKDISEYYIDNYEKFQIDFLKVE